jgi:hypothetical protein
MPKPPGNRVDSPIRGHRTFAPPPESPFPAASVLSERCRLCINTGDDCQNIVPVTVTIIFRVMAGLVPAIHVFDLAPEIKTWMPATSAGMTDLSPSSLGLWQAAQSVSFYTNMSSAMIS